MACSRRSDSHQLLYGILSTLLITSGSEFDLVARTHQYLAHMPQHVTPTIIPRTQQTLPSTLSPLQKRFQRSRTHKKAIAEKPLPKTFGKTHFIAGFPHKRFQQKKQQEIQRHANQLVSPDGSIRKALFSPDDNVRKTLLELIESEQSSIKIAIFSFTDEIIAQNLMHICNTVPIELITDPSTLHGQFSKINQLHEKGVHVFIYNPKNKTMMGDKMHDKFILFGKNINNKQLLWTGSFNFSKSANEVNQENILILDDVPIVEQFNAQFEKLKNRSRRYHA